MSAEILKKLRDDDNYYGAYGKKFLSFSDIITLLNDPAEYGKSKPPNLNMLKGSYLHHLILEPEKAKEYLFVDATTRNTKTYKAAVENVGAELLLYKEKEAIEQLVSKVKINFEFCATIYDDANEFEVPAVGEIFSHQWKGKADIITKDNIIDLKTTSKIGTKGRDFLFSAYKFNYDSQAWIYNQLFGKPLVFYIIEKETGRLATLDSLDDKFLESGRQKVIEAIAVYEKFFGENATADIEQHVTRIKL
jgi:hypothetical protein